MEDGEELPTEVGTEPRSVRLRRSVQLFLLAVVGVAVIGLMSGYLFATTNPQSAASVRIGAFVRTEAVDAPADELDTWDPAAPTSGDARGDVGCGVYPGPLAVDAQVAALASGRVLVQYRPADVDVDALDALRGVAGDHRDDLLLAPNPELAAPVVATAWGRRMALAAPDPDLLDGFATAFAGKAPAPTPCTRS